MKHYIIYIPGLGDNKPLGQALAVKLWRIYGVQAECLPMHWSTGRKFETKLNKLLARIDALTEQGYKVSLVGSSAGGSAVVNALALRPNIHAAVGICGVMNTNLPIHPRYFRKNRAFQGSVEQLPKSLEKLGAEERHRIMSIRPLWDPVVWRRSTIIRGALHKRVWSIGHSPTIALMLTFHAHTILRFIKKKAKQYE